jgi:hypothetical protein
MQLFPAQWAFEIRETECWDTFQRQTLFTYTPKLLPLVLLVI